MEQLDPCPICLDEIGDTNSCVTECGHKFCLKCLYTSLREKNTCPMCRAELVEENEDTKKIRSLENINRIYAISSIRKNREIQKYENRPTQFLINEFCRQICATNQMPHTK